MKNHGNRSSDSSSNNDSDLPDDFDRDCIGNVSCSSDSSNESSDVPDDSDRDNNGNKSDSSSDESNYNNHIQLISPKCKEIKSEIKTSKAEHPEKDIFTYRGVPQVSILFNISLIYI